MNIGIVGAGATGLSAGYELCKKGHKVVVFESGSDVGGLVSTFTVGNQPLEKFYHHIFTNDTEVIELIDELDLSSSLMWISPKSGIYINNKLYPFSTPMDLIKFKELPFIERILLGLLVLRSKSIKDWKPLESYTAKEWVEKYAGKKAYEKFWSPLLKSKFGLDADDISAVWLWNKFKLRGSTRKSTVSKEMFGYLKGSFNIIYKKLAEEITKAGNLVLTRTAVKNIIENSDGTLSINANNETYIFDKVIFTPAPALLLNMGLNLSKEYIKRIKQIKYTSNICAVIETNKQISSYYWVTVAENDAPFVLLIEHTNLMPVDDYNSNIIYLSTYLDETNPLYSSTDEEIKNIFFDYLDGMFATFNKDDVKNYKISRSQFAQPVVYRKYSDIVLDFKSPVPNLFLASMSQIYPEDRGQNYSIKLGKTIAEIVCKKEEI